MKKSEMHFRQLTSFRLHLLSRVTERIAETQYKQQFGLTLLQARVIGVLGEFEALRFGEMTEQLDLEKGQASRLVGALTERGLLEKPIGSRATLLRLTPEGRTMCDAIYAAALERNVRLLADISPADKAVLLRCLDKLHGQAQLMASHAGLQAPPVPTPDPADSKPSAGQVGLLLDRDTASRLHSQLETALRLSGSENAH